MIGSLEVEPSVYQAMYPYPYTLQDNILNEKFAKDLQHEILNIPTDAWDRYSNPFEAKYTLRDKLAFPPHLCTLFEELQSANFINKISDITGYKLMADNTRNFWGVHKYDDGDKLDIHVDAGLHPITKQKKQVTFGIYLSSNWKEEYGCKLEIWRGDNAISNDAKIHERVATISPFFNRMIMFNCNDYSWHGNPEMCKCQDNAKRIFITISYLSDNYSDLNKRQKAFFVARPGDPDDPKKDEMRILRADPARYTEVYRV